MKHTSFKKEEKKPKSNEKPNRPFVPVFRKERKLLKLGILKRKEATHFFVPYRVQPPNEQGELQRAKSKYLLHTYVP